MKDGLYQIGLLAAKAFMLIPMAIVIGGTIYLLLQEFS